MFRQIGIDTRRVDDIVMLGQEHLGQRWKRLGDSPDLSRTRRPRGNEECILEPMKMA